MERCAFRFSSPGGIQTILVPPVPPICSLYLTEFLINSARTTLCKLFVCLHPVTMWSLVDVYDCCLDHVSIRIPEFDLNACVPPLKHKLPVLNFVLMYSVVSFKFNGTNSEEYTELRRYFSHPRSQNFENIFLAVIQKCRHQT